THGATRPGRGEGARGFYYLGGGGESTPPARPRHDTAAGEWPDQRTASDGHVADARRVARSVERPRNRGFVRLSENVEVSRLVTTWISLRLCAQFFEKKLRAKTQRTQRKEAK